MTCVQAEHKMPPCASSVLSNVEIGKMYYSVGWFLKILSTSRVIALEAD